MKINTMYRICIIILAFTSLAVQAQQTTPTKFDFTQGNSYSISEYNGNTYPPNFSFGISTEPADGPFNINLKDDATYSNANNPGRWRDEGVKTMSYRGGSDELQRGCFHFRGNATGRSNIAVKWTVRVISSNTNTNYIELQWKDGSDVGGVWNDVDNDLFEQGVTTDPKSYSVILPPAANNLSDLRIRWIYYEIGTGSRDRLAIDDIVISTQPQGLPVELSYFRAQTSQNSAELSWQTLSEVNSKSFEIEKSFDGLVFSKIGEVNAKGTTNKISDYEYRDSEDLKPIQYYRLKQIDLDATYQYSNVVSLKGSLNGNVSIYPTIARDNITISLDPNFLDKFTISIYDLVGKSLIHQDFYNDGGPINVSLEGIPPGIHIVNISAPQFNQSLLFVKKE